MRKISIQTIIISIAIILALVQLYITHTLASSSIVAREMEIKATELEQENSILKEEINKLGSLKRIISQAEKNGFIAQSEVIYVSREFAVAMRK